MKGASMEIFNDAFMGYLQSSSSMKLRYLYHLLPVFQLHVTLPSVYYLFEIFGLNLRHHWRISSVVRHTCLSRRKYSLVVDAFTRNFWLKSQLLFCCRRCFPHIIPLYFLGSQSVISKFEFSILFLLQTSTNFKVG